MHKNGQKMVENFCGPHISPLLNPLYREFHSRTFLRPVMFASSANKYYPPDFHSDHTAAMLHYYDGWSQHNRVLDFKLLV